MSHEKDSIKNTVKVAAILCLVCSVVVSAAAVILRPTQQANAALDRKRNILEAGGLMEPGRSVDELFSKVEARVVDLETGEFVDVENPATYDQRGAAKNPSTSIAVPPEEDIASIRRRAKQASVYLARGQDGSLERIILPVHGYGLWSTMYAFLALEADTNTVVGLKFYEHGETPGLGGEVDNPLWQEQWPGKQVYDDNWQPAVQLAKGGVDPNSSMAKYSVDALSGASLTSNGITNLLQYWLSDRGFGTFLAKLRSEGGQNG